MKSDGEVASAAPVVEVGVGPTVEWEMVRKEKARKITRFREKIAIEGE